MLCRGAKGQVLSHEVSAALTAEMRRVVQIFPGTNLSCLLSARGELVALVSHTEKEGQEVELLAAAASLKRSALEFTAALDGDLRCPIVHVRGNDRLFSCYDVADHLLAFYTERHGMVLDQLDMNESDAEMAGVIAKLEEILQNG